MLHDFVAAGQGGTDLLCFLISSLHSASPEESWDVLLPSKTGMPAPSAIFKRGIKRLAGTDNGKGSEGKLVDAIMRSGVPINIIDYPDSGSGLAAVALNRADVLFLCRKSLGRSFPLAWIGYIADLQHKRLPHWFNWIERWHRDRVMSKMLNEAPAVVVNAAAVVDDIEQYYPHHKAQLFALPFAPPADRGRFSDDSDRCVRDAYRLPAKYFIVCNQFWIHKSHETAFMALQLVRDGGHDVHLVCTGDTSDYRWPEHFSNLKALIVKLGLQDHIHILGLIPKRDQLAIMRESVAVVQPTLFEGGPGGGSVYDAVSTRTPCIVSDIPVNREIDIGDVRHFKAGSAEDLAAKMIEIFVHPPQRPSEEETFVQLKNRQKELGRILLNIAKIVAKPSPSYLERAAL